MLLILTPVMSHWSPGYRIASLQNVNHLLTLCRLSIAHPNHNTALMNRFSVFACVCVSARVCVFICICVCTRARACVCACVYLFVYKCVSVYVCGRVDVHASVYFCMHVCMRLCDYLRMRTCVCLFACVCAVCACVRILSQSVFRLSTSSAKRLS